MINTLLKGICLALYAAAIAGTLGYLPTGLTTILQGLALLFLVVHLLELVFAIKYIRLCRGPLSTSVLLTVLFGLLHWLPLARQHKGD